jgi:hypothetical protein
MNAHNSIPQSHTPVTESPQLKPSNTLNAVTRTLVATFSQPDLPEELELVAALATELINAHELLDGLGIPRQDDYGVCTLAERIAWVTDLRPLLPEASPLVASAST